MNKLIAQEWLKAANDDLVLVKTIIAKAELTHLAAFHCQQAIEKTFKAVLENKGCHVPKKHDLVSLKELIVDELTIDNEDMLESLNSLYIESRYPGSLGLLPNGKPTIKEAQDFYTFAECIYRQAKDLI